MKEHWVRVLVICAIATAMRHGVWAQSPEERIRNLVVMIDGKLGDSPTLGAGIIFGIGQDRLYIVTANHVVRRGAEQAKELRVQLNWLPGEPQQAALLTTSDPSLDLAVLSVAGLGRIGVTNVTVPFDMLGDANAVKPGDVTHTLGYPSGRPWDIRGGDVRRAAAGSIYFETPYLFPGNSGGALLNGKYELIGLVSKDEQPDGVAVGMETVMDSLKTWGYPISFRRGAPAKLPSASTSANGGVNGDGTAGNNRLPDFAGVWETFEARQNGAPIQNFTMGRRLTITQDGSIVRVGTREQRITAAGTLSEQRFFAGPSPGHSVSAAEQADLVDTLVWRIEGPILIFESTLHYRNQFGDHAPGTDVRIIKHRRVTGDSGGPALPQPGVACHIRDVVFVGRSGAVRDALAKVTIDSFVPALAGQGIRVVLDLTAGDPNNMLLERRLETTAQPGTVDIPATLNIAVRNVSGIVPPGQVNATATTATIYVFRGPNKDVVCKGDFPIRFQ